MYVLTGKSAAVVLGAIGQLEFLNYLIETGAISSTHFTEYCCTYSTRLCAGDKEATLMWYHILFSVRNPKAAC